MERKWVGVGALLAAFGVIFGAFGAHLIRDRVDARMLETWETAAHYHQLHALAIIILGLLPGTKGREWSAWLITSGMLVFAGTLYLYVLTASKMFAIITPLGGAMMIAGWTVLAVSYVRKG